jgi:hypothetical protein
MTGSLEILAGVLVGFAIGSGLFYGFLDWACDRLGILPL